MKKQILLFASSLVIAFTGNAQTFSNGDSYYKLQYDPNGSNPNCLNNFANSGGPAFLGGNVETYGYSQANVSPNAIYLQAIEGSIEEGVSPFLFHIYYVNGDFCDPMVKSGNIVGINLTSGKVKVTAKASAPIVVEFFVANGEDTGFPGNATGGGSWEKFSYNVGDAPEIAMNLTTEYAEHLVDFSKIAAFNNWSGKSKINYWGIRFTEGNGDEVWIKSIEFGEQVVNSINNNQSTSAISVYPNPSQGNALVSTNGKTGTITVSNTNGSVVKTIQAASNQDSYELNLENKGVYIVSFVSDEIKTTQKLVIE
ncbi:MAG: T9SS type A sorting domain-containing protein [Cytophagaceae bacterium]